MTEPMKEYWVWYGEIHSLQGRPIAKFDDLEKCKEWCDDELGGYVELDRAFGMGEDAKYCGVGAIGAVEDFTEK